MSNKKVPKSDKLVAQCAQLVDAKQKGAKNREKLVALTEGASQAASLSLYVDVPLPAMSRSLYYVVLAPAPVRPASLPATEMFWTTSLGGD